MQDIELNRKFFSVLLMVLRTIK